MTSSSDEGLDCSIPEYIVYPFEPNDTKTGEKCPLCCELSKNFYCVDCVRMGNFTDSRKKSLERYADKKARQMQFDKSKANLLQEYHQKLDQKIQFQNIKFDIMVLKDKIKVLQRQIEISKNELSAQEKAVQVLAIANDRKKNLYRTTRKSVMSTYEEFTSLSNRLKSERSKLTAENRALDTLIQHRIKELETHIFPIVKVMPRFEKEQEELEEAQKTTYVQGQWVITGSPMDEMQYSVVNPRVPCTGDYSAYLAWCEECEERAVECSAERRHVAQGISAALAYAAQFANAIAFYMDERVPKGSSFFDFCVYNGIAKFHHHVAKLNANVIHLCLRRRVEVSQLSSHRTVSNLLLLVDPGDKTRCISVEEEERMMDSLEDSIGKDLLPVEDSDDEEMDYVRISDEEFPVNEGPGPEMQAYTTNLFQSVISSLYSWKTEN